MANTSSKKNVYISDSNENNTNNNNNNTSNYNNTNDNKLNNTNNDNNTYEQLRNEWKVGSKCMVFSTDFKQWIYTNINGIQNKKGQQILTVKSDHISFPRFSNNIQPIYIRD
eukprot:546608_1